MSIGKGVTKTYEAQNQDLDSAADVLTIAATKPFTVVRIGTIQNNGNDPGTGYVLAADRRPTAGTDSDVNSRGARAELFTLSPSAALGQGNGVYADADDRYDVVPGEELVLEVKSAGASNANGHVFAEVIEHPFSGVSELTNMTDET